MVPVTKDPGRLGDSAGYETENTEGPALACVHCPGLCPYQALCDTHVQGEKPLLWKAQGVRVGLSLLTSVSRPSPPGLLCTC